MWFDTGDCIKAGNLAVPLTEEAIWTDLADCTAGTIGNRETHVLEAAFQRKLAGHRHRLLCANLRRTDGSRPLPASVTLELQGMKIGVFGVSVAMVTDRMKTRFASAFRWDPPVAVALETVRALRPEVDLLIALTHIGHRQDRELAESCPEINVIFGGHSHTILETPEQVNGVWIAQGGSHARFFGDYVWDEGALQGGLVPMRAGT